MSKFVQISSDQIKLGMYVIELDRPWEGTPFLLQGFLIETDDQRAELMELCGHVIIDSGVAWDISSYGKNNQPAAGSVPLVKNPKNYENSVALEQELVTARDVYSDYQSSVRKLFQRGNGSKDLDIRSVVESADGVVKSIICNPDACVLLQQMRIKDDYLYNHAVGMSIWSAALARQIGLPAKDIKNACLAALLCDLGMVDLPEFVINKKGPLSEREFGLVKLHVKRSLEYLKSSLSITDNVIRAVRSHHERYDGSGYPGRLTKDNIPVLARLVGIADSYDAMTNIRPYAAAMSPADAVKKLYEARDILFQSELVEEFIQAVGVYPIGTLVELTSGEVGVVIAEYRYRRLKPRILVLTDANKQQVEESYYIDLSQPDEEMGEALDIVHSLEAGAYGIDSDDIFI